MIAQDLLRRAAIERLERVLRMDISRDPPNGDMAAAAVVVEDLDITTFITGALAFTCGLPDPVGARWEAGFTSTHFLAGNPRHLGTWFAFDHVTENGTMAWLGPGPTANHRGLRRCLPAFRGSKPVDVPPYILDVPVSRSAPTGISATLVVGLGSMSAAEYLVHIHHILCESVLRGLLCPGDNLIVRHRRDRLDPAEFLPEAESSLHRRESRITADPLRPDVLILHAHLTSDREAS